MTVLRKMMHRVKNAAQKHAVMGGAAGFGSARAGMHQKSENEYRMAVMMMDLQSEPVDEALEIPEILGDMIPPEEEKVPEMAEITADDEILEIIADPGASEESEDSEKQLPVIGQMSVDYSDERIPVLEPVTGGEDTGPVGLVYDSGDGTVRMIPDPLGVLKPVSIPPVFPVIEDPSANVPA